MRRVISSTGADTTTATQAYLLSTPNPIIRKLYMIGRPDDPNRIMLTDHESPVIYNPWGTFFPSTVKSDGIKCQIGLDIGDTTISWAPGNQTLTSSVSSASPLQLARLHYYDNWPVRIWRGIMASPGDLTTYGCTEWFGGRVDTCQIGRNSVKFSVKSFLNVVSQKLPPNVIESTSTLAGFTATTPATGDSVLATFDTYTGSTDNYIIADCTGPTADKIYSGNLFVGGYMVFLAGAGATLAGYWSAIGQNGAYKDGDGNDHSEFSIYTPLPWPPTPSVDKFYVSMAAPINQADGDYYGFPYVPNPESAV